MYCRPTLMLLRRPASVTLPPVVVEGDQVGGRDVDLRALAVDLVRPLAEDAVEHLRRDADEVGVGDPGAVEAVGDLALLVLAHAGHGDGVDVGVAAAGDEGRHAADRVGAALVAGLDQQLRVGAHEGHRHRDLAAVRHEQVAAGARNFLITLKM